MPSPLAAFVSDIVGGTVVDVPPGMGAFAPGSSSGSPSARNVLVSPVRTFADGVEIVALHNLDRLTKCNKERIFAHTFPYTARAFAVAHLQDGDLSTMSPENRQDHLDHTFGGNGITFLLGSASPPEEEIAAAAAETVAVHVADEATFFARPPFRLHAHLNASFVTPSATLEGVGAVVYVHAVCCDPNYQGKGFAKKIFNEAVRVLRPKARFLTLRTMNVAIVRLMALATQGDVFPVDPFSTSQRPDLQRVAEALREELGWGPALRSDTLLIPRGYPRFLVPVFKGVSHGSDLEKRIDSMIDRDAGDCLCCIADLL